MKRKISSFIAIGGLALCALTPREAQALELGKAFDLPEFNSGRTIWTVRVGATLNNASGEYFDDAEEAWANSHKKGTSTYNVGSTTSINASIAFSKAIGKTPLYWGMELGLNSRGYSADYSWRNGGSNSFGGSDSRVIENTEKLSTLNATFSPITIGYRYTFLKRMAIDVHLGGYANYDFYGKLKTTKYDYYYTSSDIAGSHSNVKEDESEIKIGDMDGMSKLDAGVMLGVGYWFGRFNLDFTWQRGFISIYEDLKIYSNNYQLRLGYAF